jgi:DNA-directed RNA polymerase subunit RPC12/RpoP
MKKKIYSLTEYACKKCGGRILQMEGNYVTGGGNPIYMCASCQQSTCDLCPDNIGEHAPQKFKELAATTANIAMPKLVVELRDIIGVCVSELAYPKDYARAIEILNQLSA